MDDSAGSEEHANFLAACLEKAREGDAVAAIKVAMMIHLRPDLAAQRGLNVQYEEFLAQGFQGKDAEAMVCTAEAFMRGKLLPASVKQAKRFLDRANVLSPFMGAFIIGRLPGVSGKPLGQGC